MAKLTKSEIDKAEARTTRYTLWDDEVRGFGVRVFPSGQKSFVLEYRPGAGGRGVAKKRVTIGVYGRDLTPDAARKLAREMLADIRRGDDPAASRRRSRAMPTFRDFAEEYLAEGKALGLSPNTIVNYGVWLRRHAMPALGGTRLDSVQPADVRRLHRAIGKTKPVTANRVVVAVRAVFNYAAAEELLAKEQNPVREVRLFDEQAVERFLTIEELERLGTTLRLAETEGLPWTAPPRADRKAKHRRKPENQRTILGHDETAAIRLLLFTGLRLREILHARWADVDMERGILTLPDSKTGRRPVILSEAALEILRTHPRSSDYIIAGLDPEKPRADLNRPWKAVRTHAELEGLRLHDLRHSFASVGAAGGMGLQIVGRLLGHRHASTTQRYAHLADDPQRRAADMIAGSIAAALAGKAKAA
ncbi:integrase [Sphingobium jiangsuense]|uniref:Integrase n=1 Tax=Sphingobium jiangsuense TaxID=870476 RepID=A0A7W6FR10_9SPHN|nr:site-specific integrase [Sphingobium jiangsuense]MBB3927237.1 integrase [Sphingobium jiangsuense]GLS99481.1 integrase [Sphingobium jiangsuense]